MMATRNRRAQDARQALIRLLEEESSQRSLLSREKIISHLAKLGFSEYEAQIAIRQLSRKVKVKDDDGNIITRPTIVRYAPVAIPARDGGQYHETTVFYGLYDVVHDLEMCPECGSLVIIDDSRTGEVVCCDCGYVLGAKSQQPDWKRVNPPIDPLRVDNPHKIPVDNRLHSSWFRMSAKNKAILYSRIFTGTEKHFFKEALPELRWICGQLQTPNYVRRTAGMIYVTAYRERLIHHGVDYRPYVLAALVLAYRCFRLPFILQEDWYAFDWEVRRALRLIIRELSDTLKAQLIAINSNELKADDYVPFLLSRLQIPFTQLVKDDITKSAADILQNLKHLAFGRKPRLVAATAIYIASRNLNIKIPQSALSRAAAVSPERISKFYQKIVREKLC
jgi:transcription initiation factor TFIIB